jgi:hypothetical protein
MYSFLETFELETFISNWENKFLNHFKRFEDKIFDPEIEKNNLLQEYKLGPLEYENPKKRNLTGGGVLNDEKTNYSILLEIPFSCNSFLLCCKPNIELPFLSLYYPSIDHEKKHISINLGLEDYSPAEFNHYCPIKI